MIVQNPLIGRAKKSLANSTFTTYRGQNVVKSKPLSVANPRTIGQTTQRGIFSQIIALARPLLPLIKKSFKEVAGIPSEYNVFTSLNLLASKASGDVLSALSNNTLVFAKGTLKGVESLEVTNPSGSDLGVSWVNNSDGVTGLTTDTFNYVILRSDASIALSSATAVSRSVGTLTIADIAADWDTDWRFIGWFTRASELKSSDSYYAFDAV